MRESELVVAASAIVVAVTATVVVFGGRFSLLFICFANKLAMVFDFFLLESSIADFSSPRKTFLNLNKGENNDIYDKSCKWVRFMMQAYVIRSMNTFR